MKKDWMVKESELDQDQIRVLMAILDKSCIVSGCAGSGKSVLALLKAQRIQKERGDNYKIIVYTRQLCSYMNAGKNELGLKIPICYHHQWNKKYQKASADYIIVDEIQDYTETEISEFCNATNKHFFFFGDTAQSIFNQYKQDRGGTMEVENIPLMFERDKRPKTFELFRNYRLPIPVARLVQYIGVDLPPFEEAIYKSKENVSPYILHYDKTEEQFKSIINIVKRDNLNDVAILLPNKTCVKSSVNILQDNNVDFECFLKHDDDTFVDNINFKTTNIKVLPIHSAKGLQFETVFIPMIEKYQNLDTSYTRKTLYVAMTRTYRNLYIMYSGEMPSLFQEIPINLYKSTETETITDI